VWQPTYLLDSGTRNARSRLLRVGSNTLLQNILALEYDVEDEKETLIMSFHEGWWAAAAAVFVVSFLPFLLEAFVAAFVALALDFGAAIVAALLAGLAVALLAGLVLAALVLRDLVDRGADADTGASAAIARTDLRMLSLIVNKGRLIFVRRETKITLVCGVFERSLVMDPPII
jgi:hypothetical protein